MKRILLPFLAFMVSVSGIHAQDAGDKWSLQRCIEYAAKNNISVKQADVQARLAKIEVERAKLAQYPNVGFNTNVGTQYGRSIDPTTNQFTSSQLLFQNLNLNTGVNVFSWGALQADKKIAAFNANAALTDVERIINDVSINVATFYLQVVATKKQIEIAEVQISQTKTQLAFTRKRVDAGALPELNAAEIEAQLARDTTTLVNAQASYAQALIQLKAAINLDMATPFEIDIPEVDKIPLESLADLDPAILYQLALSSQPAQKAAILRVKSAEESVKRAKAAFYPSLSAFGGLGSNFANPSSSVTGATVVGSKPTGSFVTVGGTNYLVFQPDVQLTTSKKSFFEQWKGWGPQLDQNFRQNIGLQLQVPIFSNGTARLGYERSKLNQKNAEITKQQIDINLQQNIYQSYTNAKAALLRFNASNKSVEASQKAYDFAAKRYEAGLSNTLDLITNQNNLLRTKLDRLNNQFDYIFRIKLLEFYKGQGIKL
ncbi:MAG: TolC family protein [Sediminibacterium sp.]|nr:TolC family protein [Sediminibacterium sp.]MBX9781373.1 TolC family protein [Chitinophagaceae bacterium]